jgi:hypothetical protein
LIRILKKAKNNAAASRLIKVHQGQQFEMFFVQILSKRILAKKNSHERKKSQMMIRKIS